MTLMSQLLAVPGIQEALPKMFFYYCRVVVVALPFCCASGSFWWAGYNAGLWDLREHRIFEACFIRGEKKEAQGHPHRTSKGQRCQLEETSL